MRRLALVKQLAELHGGRVSVKSAGQGQGSCFKVWLPLAMAGSQSALAAQTKNHLDGLSLLVVDDEAELLGAFGSILKGEGAVVQTAVSAVQALELAQTTNYDVIISDIGMPEQDGYWLVNSFGGRTIPATWFWLRCPAWLGKWTDREPRRLALTRI